MKHNYFWERSRDTYCATAIKTTLFFLLISLFGFNYGQAQQLKPLKGSKTMEVRYLGTSPKLTNIKPIPSKRKGETTGIYIVPNKLSKTGLIKQIRNKRPDPVMQKNFNNVSVGGAQVKVGFDGGSNQDNETVNRTAVSPPDTQGDVGPNHYVQMTNSITTIFDKSGNTLFGPVPNSIFFQNLDPVLAGTNDGDPVVLYDQFEDRWIVSQFAVSQGAPYFMLVAVSETSDPLGSYNQYAIDYGTDFPDYPKLGIWNDALYITTRDFIAGPTFKGFSIVAINKFDMYNGEETASQRFEINNPEFDGILPADADGSNPPPAGEPHYSMYLSASGTLLNLITTTIDFDDPANSSLVFGSIDVAPYTFFDTLLPQPNGQDLDALPFFLMYRLQYLNFGTHASMLTNHTVQEQAGGEFGIRWYEFRNSGGLWNTFQQGTYLPDDSLNRWLGSIAMNENGDIALGYSVASAALNPSIRFVGQTASESGSGILNIPETSILEGQFSSNGASRWGDYSMMSIDPVDQDFWFTTEYIAVESPFSGWGTYISEMAFGEPPTAVCQDITVEVDANDGSVTIRPDQIDDGSTGPNGGEITLSLNIDTFDCSNLGENEVILTATSTSGTISTCTAIVTVNVIDTEVPVAVCKDILIELNGESVEIAPEQLDGGSTDNCGIASLVLDQTAFTELGTFPVILTITDTAGLTDSCEAMVTVAEGAMIEVNPTSLSASVDLQVDNPPVVEEILKVSNNGGVPLEFDVLIGTTEFTSSGQSNQDMVTLDRSVFKGNTSFSGPLKAAGVKNTRLKPSKFSIADLAESSSVIDSVFYDSGVNFPGDFVGFDDPSVSLATGVRFDVPGESFTLTAVRNAYRTETLTGTTILLSVYRGGDLPENGELLLEQVVTGDSADGVFAFEALNTALTFNAGEHFWLVHTYPLGLNLPQGFDNTISNTRPNTYAFSGDGGTSFNLIDGFASLVRALSDGRQDNSFISLSPESATVAPGESIDIVVALNGDGLANGTYETDLNINSNDVSNQEVIVPTTFTVTGQTLEIEVSEELLQFNDVLVGSTSERSFIISNTGGVDLNVASITSNNDEFIAEPSLGRILPGGELEVVVTYSPASLGNSNGILSIASDADNSKVIEVLVNGIGVENPLALLTPNFVQESVFIDESVQTDITIRNDGGGTLNYSFPEFTMAMALQDPNAQIQRAEFIEFPNFANVQSKGFLDNRRGSPVQFGMGTDLEFGYTWMDSDEANGPIAEFIDIIPLGATDLTDLLTTSDGFADETVGLDLPLSIPFYGKEYQTIFVSANGFVAFEDPTGLSAINGQIPEEDFVNNVIAPLWTDLEPGVEDEQGRVRGTVHIATFTDAVVVQWTDAPGFVTVGTVTFQVIIFTNGTIDVQYEDMSSASFLDSATIGIENSDATDGAQIAFNADYVKDNFAVRFMPPGPVTKFITALSTTSGSLGAGEEETIKVTLDGKGLAPDVYLQDLMVSSNSMDLDSSSTTFELTVNEQKVVGFTLVNADTNEEIGLLNDGDVIDLSTFDTDIFNLVADIGTGEKEGSSVVFDYNGTTRFQVENVVPYALGGDIDGDFKPFSFHLGTNTVTATPYSARNGKGEAGIPASITFEVVNGIEPELMTMTLVNADTDEEIGLLNDGDVIDLSTFDTDFFNLVADTGTGEKEVSSVVFDYNGTTRFQVENIVPYALGGDIDGDFKPFSFHLGTNTVTATPYSARNGKGEAGIPTSITFEVVNGIEPEPELTGMTLVNADTDEVVGLIQDGDILDLNDYPSTGLSIIADTDIEGVGSVIFSFNGVSRFQVENVVPYSLDGDIKGNFNPVAFVSGTNTVTAKVYTARDGGGAISGELNISFEVIPETATAAAKVYPNPVTNIANFTIEGSKDEVLQGALFNISGQVVSPFFDFKVNDRGEAFLDMTNVPQGTYILKLRDNKGEWLSQVKLLKQ